MIEAKEILKKHVSVRGSITTGNYTCVSIKYEDAIKAVEEISNAAELYARSMAAQAWEEACEAQIKLCAEDLPERWLINMVKDTPKPINPYKP